MVSQTRPTIRERLARWTYPYVPAAFVTFLAGAILGAVAVAVTPAESLAATAEAFGETNPFPDRLTMWTIFQNNIVVLGIVALGVVTFAVTAIVALFLNGFLLGVLFGAAGGERLLTTILLVAPHGVFELGSFFVVGGVAYRVTWRLISYLRGIDDAPITRQEAGEAIAAVLLSAIVLAVAAWIEATLTLEIARVLSEDIQ